MSPEEVARAFSTHHFDDAYPHLAPEVSWVSPGEWSLHGRKAVVEACRRSAAELSSVTTCFTRFVVVPGSGDTAAVDAVAEYTDADGQRSVVSSCDIYEFAGSQVTTITSYAVELTPDATA